MYGPNIEFKYVNTTKNPSDVFTRVDNKNKMNNLDNNLELNGISTRSKNNENKDSVAQRTRSKNKIKPRLLIQNPHKNKSNKENINNSPHSPHATAMVDTETSGTIVNPSANTEAQEKSKIFENNLQPHSSQAAAMVDTETSETIFNSSANTEAQENPKSPNSFDPETNKIDDNIKNKILTIHKRARHVGARKLYNTLVHVGQCPFKSEDELQNFLSKNCTDCAAIENHRLPRKSIPGITPTPNNTNEVLFIDHKLIASKVRLSRYNEDQSNIDQNPNNWTNRYVVSIFEPLSSLVYFYPVPDQSTEFVKCALRMYIQNFGNFKTCISDNAKCLGKELEVWLRDEYDTSLQHTSVYHPNSNLSEKAHSAFNKALDYYNKNEEKFGSDSWADTLTKLTLALNCEKNPITNLAPIEIFRNRSLKSIGPSEFYNTSAEGKCSQLRFQEKVKNVMNSKLKISLNTYTKGQNIKVKFKDKEAKTGVVLTDNDDSTKSSVLVKFINDKYNSKAVSVNKNSICNALA